VQHAPSAADQIAQMWQLVQAGAMTRGEFEQQKARLLGPTSPANPQGAPQQPWPVNRGPAQGGPPPQHGWR
jgi:hypothetical protein